eukprot:gnl/TRDRNA2_/TRDRNA2_173166_c1_seq1.p2 gnl/TRDRNA2_/TRDRNA2_173166_c1~~gnl/TRDRNA2_/TRDRNA2_173166_c1_seq1.p2  ORF type:complete len:177 (+),score=2.16 gnl/TRDRNA2_/TRDRNA2_173166_c1_seq1:577-1107(+)
MVMQLKDFGEKCLGATKSVMAHGLCIRHVGITAWARIAARIMMFLGRAVEQQSTRISSSSACSTKNQEKTLSVSCLRIAVSMIALNHCYKVRSIARSIVRSSKQVWSEILHTQCMQKAFDTTPWRPYGPSLWQDSCACVLPVCALAVVGPAVYHLDKWSRNFAHEIEACYRREALP